MTVFAAMFDTLFADPNMAAQAVYTPPGGGAPVPCAVMFRAPDFDWRGGEASVTTPARVAELRVSEVALVEEEGVLEVAGRTYTVQHAKHPDADRLLWRVELR